MGTIVSYDAYYIEWRQTSKEKIAMGNTMAQCEWSLTACQLQSPGRDEYFNKSLRLQLCIPRNLSAIQGIRPNLNVSIPQTCNLI